MSDIFQQMRGVLIAGVVGGGLFGYAVLKREVEPFQGSLTLTISLGFATGCLAGAFLTLYDKIQALKKSDDPHRWRVRHAGLLEFGWWVLLIVGTIAVIGAATLVFN